MNRDEWKIVTKEVAPSGRWHLTSAYMDDVDENLVDGWEPFAIGETHRVNGTRVWLKKFVLDDEEDEE